MKITTLDIIDKWFNIDKSNCIEQNKLDLQHGKLDFNGKWKNNNCQQGRNIRSDRSRGSVAKIRLTKARVRLTENIGHIFNVSCEPKRFLNFRHVNDLTFVVTGSVKVKILADVCGPASLILRLEIAFQLFQGTASFVQVQPDSRDGFVCRGREVELVDGQLAEADVVTAGTRFLALIQINVLCLHCRSRLKLERNLVITITVVTNKLLRK